MGGFPSSSAGKESTCNAGDMGSISGLGMERQVQSLGREDPLEEGVAIHSSIFVWRILWTGLPWWISDKESMTVYYKWDCLTSVSSTGP